MNVKNHDLYREWSIVNGWQEVDTARTTQTSSGKDALNVYPCTGEITDELTDRMESEFPVECVNVREFNSRPPKLTFIRAA